MAHSKPLVAAVAAGIVIAAPAWPGSAASAPAPQAAPAAHAKRCGIVTKRSRDYLVRARRIKCRRARRWTRAYLRRGREARGFACYRTDGRTVFYCSRGSRYYWAERL
jgi:hypothetical protein